MVALAPFARRLQLHRKRARLFHRLARLRHLRAALLARRAMVAQRNGRVIRARSLLKRALLVKAAAARAGMRSQFHRRRFVMVLRARRLNAQRRASKA
jgi:hypothetical protein